MQILFLLKEYIYIYVYDVCVYIAIAILIFPGRRESIHFYLLYRTHHLF